MSDLNNRPTIVTKDSRGRAELRRYAFSPVLLDGTTVLTANLIVAAPESEALLLSSLVVTDLSNGVAEFALYITTGAAPAAGDIAFGNKVIKNNEGYLDLGNLFLLNPGESLFATSNTANEIRVAGWATAYL